MKYKVDAGWGSENIGYRLKIREAISSQFGGQAKSDLLDLEVRPQLFKGYISVSHTKGLGGFVWNSSPVGFDMEPEDRVTEAVVLRISSPEEFLAAPSPVALWCAKEAAYKSMAETVQPKIISEFEIVWKDLSDPERLVFGIKETERLPACQGSGIVTKYGRYVLATFEYDR